MQTYCTFNTPMDGGSCHCVVEVISAATRNSHPTSQEGKYLFLTGHTCSIQLHFVRVAFMMCYITPSNKATIQIP